MWAPCLWVTLSQSSCLHPKQKVVWVAKLTHPYGFCACITESTAPLLSDYKQQFWGRRVGQKAAHTSVRIKVGAGLECPHGRKAIVARGCGGLSSVFKLT